MKLLSEQLNPIVEGGTDTIDGEKFAIIEGIFAQAEIKNNNNRMYPSSVLMPQIDKFIVENVQTGSAWGEVEHPEYPMPNLNKASHLVTELKVDGNNVLGKARIAKTPQGAIVEGLLRTGGRIAVSTRGLGTLTKLKEGYSVVNEDYRMFAIDIVGSPGAPDAYINGILESVEWLVEDGKLIKMAAGNIIKEVKSRDPQKIMEGFKSLMNLMSKFDTV
jgi:hypothetical protein